MGLDWMDGWLSYTAVTPRASLQSDANKNQRIPHSVDPTKLCQFMLACSQDIDPKVISEPLDL